MASDDPGSVPLDELAGRAERLHIAVVGGGVAGLVAALECAKVGLRVTVFEAADRLGGTVRTLDVDGLAVDVGADGFSPRGTVAALVTELGLDDAVAVPRDVARRVCGVPGVAGPMPLPDDAVLGIPENVWSDTARAILGTSGTWRAYVDRLRPPLTIGHQRSLGRLVRTRMGDKALRRLVAPVTGGVFFADPDDIDVDLAAPGLNAALTRAGSLSGAVGMLRGGTGAPSVRGLVGGMSRLVDAVHARLDTLGAVVRCDSRVSTLERSGDAGWAVHVAADERDAPDAAPDRFDGVIVATPEAEARRLLAPRVPDLADTASEVTVETVTLVVDAAGLDATPAGAEIVAVPGTHAASSVLLEDARWEWLADAARAAAPHRHVVRVAFARAGGDPADTGARDDAAERAREQASVLGGVTLPRSSVRAACRAVFTAAPPYATIGRAAAVRRLRTAIAAVPGLAATGAWLSGGGIAQVVPDAVQAAETLRRRVLFGGRAAS